MGKMRKCNKKDCYAIDNYAGVCTLLKPSINDKINECSFYCSDPDGEVKKQIQADIRHYYNENLGNDHRRE